MIGLYWIEIPEELLADNQKGHDQCGPFYFGVEVEDQRVRFELLVRSTANLHCTCIAHANSEQRQFVLNIVDKMLEVEQIKA